MFNRAGPELETLIKKVIKIIKTSKAAQSECGSHAGDVIILNSYYLECAAGNHAFDDSPEVFEIAELDGHRIRRYFQENGGPKEFREYIQSLIDSVK